MTDTAARHRPHLSVVAPCYDEAEGIEAVIRGWDVLLGEQPFESEIVVCDDGSRDGTGVILVRLAETLPRLRVVTLESNAGYGQALSAAIAGSHGAVVVTLDSDGQFDLADGLTLARRLEEGGFDCVTGYRRRKNDRLPRVAADRALNGIVRALFGVRLRDTNCALKAVRGEMLRGLRIEARGYPTPTEVVLRLAASGARIEEAPVDHHPRSAGQSKLRPFRTAVSMMRFLLYLRGRLRLYREGIIVAP
jgi:glycosyltransferase involved in cell wall biosynthesis